MQTVAFGEDAEVVKTGDVVVTLKFFVVRDLQNAGAFLAERRLFPSSLHHHRRPFYTQVNHRYAHTLNNLPERSTRDLFIRCDVDQYVDNRRRSYGTPCEAKTRFCRARSRQKDLIIPHDRDCALTVLPSLHSSCLRRLK
jgi:hypothetical protein